MSGRHTFSYTRSVLRHPSRPFVALACAFAVLVGACSDDAAPSATSVVELATTTTERADDGTLQLGIIVPQGGAGAELGQGLSDGVDLAVTEINGAGGVNGTSIRRIIRPEGANLAATAMAVQDLLDAGVDAIIGPASSTGTLAVLDRSVDAGVLTCSPTASTLALDDYPDRGLFLRTIPSDSLQAIAIAQAVDKTGTPRAALTYIDDAYGRPFAEAVASALVALGIEVSISVPFSVGDASISTGAASLAALEPAVVVVIADAVSGPAMLLATDLAARTNPPLYVVNDAMRRPASTVQPFAPSVAARITGVSPLAFAEDERFVAALRTVNPATTGLYAANAYDCVNLIALAAVASGSTSPARIASSIVAVSVNGSSCTSFTACSADLAAGRNIDYDGPGGVLALGGSGDLAGGVFELFGFDDSGRDVAKGELTLTSP